MVFELIIYLRKIDPLVELAWTRWIREEEETYNEMFLLEGLREAPLSSVLCSPMVNSIILATKWADMVGRN